jgi:general secretion pathway protein J
MTRWASEAASDTGFSLVESLASLVIVGMIALMLMSGVTTGRRVWERMDIREAGGEALESAQRVLRDRIDEAYPATLFNTVPASVDFQGQAENLVFLSSPPDAGRPAPLRRYRLYLDAAGEMVLASISDVAPRATAVPDRQVLLTGVRQIDVAYFGPQAPDGRRQWRRTWQGQPSLPELVRVRLQFMPGDFRGWPDLIIRTRATIDSACQIDKATHGCQGRT